MRHLASWIQRSSADESIRLIKELALAHAYKGGQTGCDIARLILSDSFRELCAYDLDYVGLTVLEARNCRQALAFFKKCTYLPLGEDTEKAAVQKFVKAELKCRETNEVFSLRDQGLFNLESWADVAITRAKAKISRVLGPLPKLSELDFKFGPGATTLTKKSRASIPEKLEAGFSCSEDLLPYASRIMQEFPVWFDLHQTESRTALEKDSDGSVWEVEYGRAPVVVTPGRVNFVPKDAMTSRTVIVEGSLNVIVQGAIGRYMFRRLRASGIDLSDQTLNQRMARRGSLTGDLATLDLVSASDMMAIAIVRELLPWEWYFFLSTMRSSTVTLKGVPMMQEKFSSMGNGYTFPLQSLIFWALASSVSSGEISVYGDDIICPTDDALLVMRLLEVCGFEINRRKSYWAGPFRESCGADYLSGFDVRPWYHRDVITPADLFRLHNFYVRNGEFEMAEVVKDLINPGLVIYGPDGYGDGHLLGDWTGRPHKRAVSHGYGGVLFDTYKLSARRDKRQSKGLKVLPCYSIYVRENADPVVPEPDPDQYDNPVRSYGRASYLRIYQKYGSTYAVEPLPEWRDASGDRHKACSLPGTEGYVRVSIYTFNASNR